MKCRWNGLAAGALALALALGLTACGGKTGGTSKFDAATYVDGLIRENYLGECGPEYLELVGITAAEVRDTYESGIDLDASYFMYIYDIDYPTDEFTEQVRELYREIYTHTKYEVVSAAEQEDGSFSVKVNIYPIDIVQLVDEIQEERMADFYEEYPMDVINAMSDKEYEELDREWAELVLGLYQEMLPETGNMSMQSVTVQVEMDEDGYYCINSDDFGRIDELIVDYSNNMGVSV